MYNSIKDIVDSEISGKYRVFSWRKSPTQANTTGYWFDISMSPGNPVPIYYASTPLEAVQLKQSTHGGLYHGSGDGILKKFSTMINGASGLPMPMIICDYLMYYPFIDDGILDDQILINNVSLPRYSDGKGVQVMAVSVAARTGGSQFYFTYTNQDGVSNRISKTVTQNSITAIGTIVNSATITNTSGPFIGLQDGDTGVRSIESVTMLTGDVGLFTLVLVKPLLTTQLLETTSPTEEEPFIEKSSLPKIYDDAFLSFICLPSNAINVSKFLGTIETIF